MHDIPIRASIYLYIYIYIYGLFQPVCFGGGWERPRNLDEPAAELAGKEVDLVVMPPSPRAVTGGHGWPWVAMVGWGMNGSWDETRSLNQAMRQKRFARKNEDVIS